VYLQVDPENPAPTLGEIVFTVFDWMTSTKGSLLQTKDIWEYTKSLFPSDNNMGGFQSVMAILKKHRLETLKTIPVCVNFCVAYWNPTHPDMQGREFRNAHRTCCPKCDQDRYLSDGKTERRRMYYFPFREWYQDLFTKTDLMQAMENDLDPASFPSGHVRRSDGWRRKVNCTHSQYNRTHNLLFI
jgi:hypothetical protein